MKSNQAKAPTAHQIRDVVYEDIERAQRLCRLYTVLQPQNAFFSAHTEIGGFLPGVIFSDMVATTARLYDDHKAAGSLRAFVKLARTKMKDTKAADFEEKLRKGFGLIEKARHGHLAHRDASTKLIFVASGHIRVLVGWAEMMYAEACEALFPGRSWIVLPGNFESDVEAFGKLLKSWRSEDK